MAIGLAASSFALWVGVDTCMKLAGEASLPPYEIVAAMGLIGALMMLLFYGPRGKLAELWPKKPHSQVIRGNLSLISVFCNAIALKHLPLTLFYVTVFTAPMVIAILAAFILKERLTIGKALAVIAGFIGVVIAINPFQDFSNGEWIGYAAATASTMSYAISTIWLRRLTQGETTASTTFITSLVEGFGCSVFLFWYAAPITPYIFGLLFAMGLLCTIGNFAFYGALKFTTAANVAQFHYIQIILGALAGYLIWRDVPEWHLYLGAALIIASGLYIANHARKASTLVEAH